MNRWETVDGKQMHFKNHNTLLDHQVMRALHLTALRYSAHIIHMTKRLFREL